MEAVLASSVELTGAELLEIGTGSGFMAQYFAERVGPAGRVDAVDVIDQRKVTNGFAFHQVSDTCLPFDDASYDIVITNHVIEHVGDRAAQLHHLQEVKRVLRPDGCVYLAVPNRWRLVEPHYKVPFLSWPTRSLRTPYLRLTGRGKAYDCEPLSHLALGRLVREGGFGHEQKTFAAMRAMLHTESPSSAERLILAAPTVLLKLLYPFHHFLAPTRQANPHLGVTSADTPLRMWLPYVRGGHGTEVLSRTRVTSLRAGGHQTTTRGFSGRWQHFPGAGDRVGRAGRLGADA